MDKLNKVSVYLVFGKQFKKKINHKKICKAFTHQKLYFYIEFFYLSKYILDISSFKLKATLKLCVKSQLIKFQLLLFNHNTFVH